MIGYDTDGGTFYPQIICDACAHPITRNGNVYWLIHDNGEIRPGLWHTHKWPCSQLDRAIESKFDGHVYFEELDAWLHQLCHNFQHTEITQ